jgi:cysteinyl-tRNA synthetase
MCYQGKFSFSKSNLIAFSCFLTRSFFRLYPLMVYNSLSRSKIRFIPKDPKRVLMYQCGPTVYAESHMGHARTYIQLDILRRIMTEYCGFNVVLCQNITDIDDKIIIRSSESKIPFRELAAKFEGNSNVSPYAPG